MKNILGREVPDEIKGYGKVKHYGGYLNEKGVKIKKSIKLMNVTPEDKKLYKNLDTVLE